MICMCWKCSVASHQYIRELKSTCRPPARYALTRLPDKLAAHPLSQALFGLLAATLERNYDHIYSRAESLFHYAQQSDFPDEKLGEVVASMTKAFVGSWTQLPSFFWYICDTCLQHLFKKGRLCCCRGPSPRCLCHLHKHIWDFQLTDCLLVRGGDLCYVSTMSIMIFLATKKHGWSYDVSNQYFTPAPLPSAMVTPIYAHGM